MRPYGGQSQTFGRVVNAVAKCQSAAWKVIDPNSDILRDIKAVAPRTETIVRVYTGPAAVDDVNRYPDAYAYGKAYVETCYRAVQDPKHMDLLELENEPQDYAGIGLTEFIKRLNAFMVGAGERGKQLGVRLLGPNFSTGYPEVYVPNTDYELWPNAWQGLADGLRAVKATGGGLSIHEYDCPDLFRLWSDAKNRGYLIGRHKAVYDALPVDLQDMPLYITEFGIDWIVQGVTGGFWHNRGEDAPQWYISQMRQAWDRVYKSTPQLKAILHYLHGGFWPQWEEYDSTRTDTAEQAIISFWSEDLPYIPIPPTPIPGGPVPITAEQRKALAWKQLAVPYNPDAAFAKVARAKSLGMPETVEYRETVGGTVYAGQNFAGGFVMCAEGDWANAKAYSYDTGEELTTVVQPPVTTPPSGTLPAFQFPDILSAAGFVGVPYAPAAGHTFYRLSPGAAVKQSVSAFCEVVVIGPDNAPAIGVQVVSLRADGKGEIQVTGGDGKAKFNFGTGSAFTPPTRPPFEVFMAEGAVKDDDTKLVSVKLQVSDSVFVGDTRGEHTEIYLQFRGYRA